MSADARYSVFRSERLGMTQLLETTPRLRTEVLPRVVTVTRLRMVLLSYLLSVPASLGYPAKGPFLDIDLAMRMLTLPPEQRCDRRWQREFFVREGVDLEEQGPTRGDRRNTLNFRAMRQFRRSRSRSRCCARWSGQTTCAGSTATSGLWTILGPRLAAWRDAGVPPRRRAPAADGYRRSA